MRIVVKILLFVLFVFGAGVAEHESTSESQTTHQVELATKQFNKNNPSAQEMRTESWLVELRRALIAIVVVFIGVVVFWPEFNALKLWLMRRTTNE